MQTHSCSIAPTWQRICSRAAAVPAVSSFAQSADPIYRAEVKAQPIQLQKVGYQPGRADPNTLTDIQAAEARVAAQNGVATGRGGVVTTDAR